VAVAGVVDAEWGQRVVAWVVPAEPARPPSLADLRAVMSEHHPTFMAPKELVLIDEVPRTALGKVVRSALAAGHAPSSD
jgi:O-succinylbenzoic acid--CoA ligase